MRALNYLMIICLLSIFACQGPQGPEGPVGPKGNDGDDGIDGEEGYTFEYVVDFTDPDYQVFWDFPNDFTVLESDVVLVYFLWAVEDYDGEDVDVWRLLPQNILTDQGLLQYNYDFTKYDVSVFMDGEFDISTLGADYTDGWVVRVVVVPAQFADGGRAASVDYSNYQEVVDYYGLENPPVDEKYKQIKRYQ